MAVLSVISDIKFIMKTFLLEREPVSLVYCCISTYNNLPE